MKQLLLPAFLLLFSPIFAQNIFFVDRDANGSGDGSSWANAFLRVQQALAVAQDGDQVWVANGTYKPSSSNDRFAAYNLPSGVKMYGGFAGNETAVEQRNWIQNPTILSGDIGIPGDSTDNAYNILYSYSPNDKTLLDGLIFEEGNANNTDNNIGAHRPTRSGAAIYLDGELFGYAELSIKNCTFRRNRALFQGGAVYLNGREGGMAIARLEQCIFERNIAGVGGGGLSVDNYFEQPFPLEIKDCVFKDNYCGSSGSAVYLRANQAVSFSNCKFLGNYCNGGGAVFFVQLENNYSMRFSNCVFEKNSRYAVYYPNLSAQNPFFFSFKACTFSENDLPAISITANTVGASSIENCAFLFNSPPNIPPNSGFVFTMGAYQLNPISISNTLFYKNKGVEIASSAAKIYNSIFIDDVSSSFASKGIFYGLGPFDVSNSLFRLPLCDSLGTNFNGFMAQVICDGTNQFSADPMFELPVIGPAGDFHLKSCSPAINAGSNAILDTLGITTDLEGNPRVRNGLVDLGPFERSLSLQPSVSAEPSCAGAHDGAISLNPEICQPFMFSWNNGDTTGTDMDHLAGGTYVFTAIGGNNVQISDTVVLIEPLPLMPNAVGHEASCFGTPSGWVEANPSGGTAPYVYTWDGIVSTFGLPAGTYTVHVEDANGCSASEQAVVGTNEQIQYFYTIQDATCFGCSDGSIVFDSVVGGVNPPLPAPMTNLPLGNYCLTLTDGVGCQSLICFNILSSSATQSPDLAQWLKLSPNPTLSGENAQLEWLGEAAATLRVLDLQGRVLVQKRLAAHSTTALLAQWPAGMYQIDIQTDIGQRGVLRWVVF